MMTLILFGFDEDDDAEIVVIFLVQKLYKYAHLNTEINSKPIYSDLNTKERSCHALIVLLIIFLISLLKIETCRIFIVLGKRGFIC